ncbi:MAG: alanine racemase [Candidatus Jorgensenbacteria bacterium]|nr:alanine racemase [Candidatus Jorgensenbacteria bacterium]
MGRTQYKTWIEIKRSALARNIQAFRSILKKPTKLFAVVKSNAYGHGLTVFPKLADELGADGFCVDSVIEGKKLRKGGITKPIIVLGPSLNHFAQEAARDGITITVSNFDALNAIQKDKTPVDFHLKIDTGMHRQGFYVSDLPKALSIVNASKLLQKHCIGACTHFASAKNLTYPDYTLKQIEEFEKAKMLCKESGLRDMQFHASATGGALLFPQSHYDIVRVGIGLYGHWPTKESAAQHPITLRKTLALEPVLSWRATVSEVKHFAPGDFIGYDLTERITKPTLAAIIPIGYWHGIPRVASGRGEVLIRGVRAKILGRVSMDLITVALPPNSTARVGDTATIIGKDEKEFISAEEFAEKCDSINYEALTCINPLIERVVV